jgi:cytidylate kinase
VNPTPAKRPRPIIAIDGPVGVGKSTVARELARELGFRYINTGAMYRAVAIAARERGLSADQSDIEARLAGMLDALTIELEGDRILLEGRDVTPALSEPEIGELASRLSALAVVRQKMRDLQQAMGREGGLVMEGRDIGTAIFPDAEFKFFLDAEVEVRADRRFAELKAKNVAVTREQVLVQLQQRDRRDSSRELAPLRCAADAFVIDSSRFTVAQVLAQIQSRIKMGREARSK